MSSAGRWQARLGRLDILSLQLANWRELFGWLGRARGRLLLLASLGILQSVLMLPILHLVRQLFDHAIPARLPGQLVLIGLAVLALRMLASALYLWHRALSLRLAKDAVSELRGDLIAWLYRTPHDFFDRHDAARIHSRIVQETERIDNLANALLSRVLPPLLTCILLGAALLYINWRMVLLAVILVSLARLGTNLTGRLVREKTRSFQQDYENFSQGVSFVIRQMRLTRLRGFERAELGQQRDGIAQLGKSGIRMAMSYAWHNQLQSLVVSAIGLALLVAGGLAVISGIMTLGDLLAFYLGAGFLNVNLSQVTGSLPDIAAGDGAMDRLRQLRALETQPVYRGERQVGFLRELVLHDVAFSYEQNPLFDQVSLTLRPGNHLVIIGPNGTGKSTIADLILGFLRPTAGSLSVDGVPYDEVDIGLMRRSMGVVPQHPTFFNGTVAENIAYGWPELGRAAVEEAARLAHADDFIRRLPQGYDTRIGEGGALLSGGEAQRLAIARALIGHPRLLILDEPTNHLDAASVAGIMHTIAERGENVAVLTISHDPAVIDSAATVLRLHERRLVREENHAAR